MLTLYIQYQQYLWATRPWSARNHWEISLRIKNNKLACNIDNVVICCPLHLGCWMLFGVVPLDCPCCDNMIHSLNHTHTQAPLYAQPKKIYNGPLHGVNPAFNELLYANLCKSKSASFWHVLASESVNGQLCQHWNHWTWFQRYISWNHFHNYIVISLSSRNWRRNQMNTRGNEVIWNCSTIKTWFITIYNLHGNSRNNSITANSQISRSSNIPATALKQNAWNWMIYDETKATEYLRNFSPPIVHPSSTSPSTPGQTYLFFSSSVLCVLTAAARRDFTINIIPRQDPSGMKGQKGTAGWSRHALT